LRNLDSSNQPPARVAALGRVQQLVVGPLLKVQVVAQGLPVLEEAMPQAPAKVPAQVQLLVELAPMLPVKEVVKEVPLVAEEPHKGKVQAKGQVQHLAETRLLQDKGRALALLQLLEALGLELVLARELELALPPHQLMSVYVLTYAGLHATATENLETILILQ